MQSQLERNNKKSKFKRAFATNIWGYLFISPWLVGFLWFMLIPMIFSLYYSFTKYDLFSAPQWVGFENYIKLFQDEKMITSFLVTFKYVFLSVPLRLAFALFIAMLLSKKHRGLSFYRTTFYMPSIVGGSIAVAIMWSRLFGHGGAIMSLMERIGFPQQNSLLGTPETALDVLILLSVWQYGSSMLTFLAGIKNIPNSYYEAAAIDGASSLHRFFKITIPMLTPVIYSNLLMQLIAGFITFTQALVITDGGPLNSTLLSALYMYRHAFEYYNMGYASAMAWMLLLIISVFTFVVVKTSDKWVFYESGGKN